MPRAAAGASPEIPLDRVMRIAAFRLGLSAFLRHTERACRRWGLTSQRYLLLLAIKGEPGGGEQLSFTDLAGCLQLSRNTVTELVGRAEQAGLVAREPSADDHRVVHLRLTGEGERRLQGVLAEIDDDRRRLRASFDELARAFEEATVSRRRSSAATA